MAVKIQKTPALAGLGIRGEIDRWIKAGEITINGVTEITGETLVTQ